MTGLEIKTAPPHIGTRAEVLAVLRAHEAEIRKLGATALYLYGSAARDELGPDSDIDLFIDYDIDGPFGFVEFFAIKDLLESAFSRDVDFTTRRGLHKGLRRRIEASSIQVF